MPDTYWCDIGTPSEYRRATADVLARRVGLRGARVSGVPPDAKLAAGVAIEGDVYIGNRVRVGTGTRILGPSVIGDGALIGNDVVIDRSILWDDVVVGNGARLEGAIVGMDYEVDPNARINGEIVANAEAIAN